MNLNTCDRTQLKLKSIKYVSTELRNHAQSTREIWVRNLDSLEHSLLAMREELFGKTEKRQVSVTGQILIENVAARAAKLTKAASDFHKNIHLYVSKNGKVIDKHAEPNPHFTSICDLTWSQGRRVVGFNLIYDYTMITGLNGVGSALKKETQLEYEFDVKEPDTLKQIVLDLEDGDITSSLEYLEKTRPPEEEALRKSLQTQMITDCIESGLPSYDRTVRHLRKYKSPFTEDKERAKRLVGALLLGKASKNDVRYRNLFDNTSRSTISKKMTSFFVPYEAPLKNLLKYGYRNVARIAELSNLNYGTNTCIVPNELPIGSYINVNHSAFACPILKEQCTFSNPPMRLICGHVVSRDAITRLTSTHRSSRNGARSKRRGFLHYVQGQIRNIAEELFQTEVVIELLDIEHDMNLEHIIMRLHFNNLDFNRQGTAYRNLNDSILEKVKITSDIFFDIFPFIIVFNRGMRIRNIGIGLLRVMAGIVGKKINQTFLLMRPFIRFRWEEIMLHSNNIFELISCEPIQEDEDGLLVYKSTDVEQMTEERHRMGDVEREKFLSLKGQMFYMEEWESICYVGIPVMSHLPQMYKSGLFINDFALHDSSRDLVLASTQQAAELKLLLHQEAQKSRNMRENMNRLKKERRRTDKLLYQMLPKSVANLLRNGESAVACCERFDSVTILFTDIVEFTKMCSSLTPLEVIEFLQVIYTNFDKIIDVHGVYKVETIGDAYMVVSGAPTKTEHDAEFILDCASQFLVEAGKMVNMSAKIPKIDIRAGVHSGSVVAGVVGLSMPRYCLFGETVFVANKMEQNSVPMKVLVSETTHNKIEESDPGLYQFEMREEIEIRDEQTIQTFFVVSRHGPPRVPSPRNCESRQDDSRNEEDDDDDLIFPGKAGRKSPTSEAEDELKKKGQLSFTPVSDTGIERHSRNSNRTHSQDITPRNSLT